MRNAAVTRGWTPDWTVFDEFRRPLIPAWSPAIDGWLEQVKAFGTEEAHAIRQLLAHWKTALGEDGDPSFTDWHLFRPLRLSREEDWTDWLAHLLEARDGQAIAARLFPPADPANELEAAIREDRVLDGKRRADLVLLWSGNQAAHVEVKVGDEQFEKTAETGEGCRKKYGRSGPANYVLIPEESHEAWRAAEQRGVRFVTWDDVVVELRRELLNTITSLHWRAFAVAFCGAVEQQLLGAPLMHAPLSVRFTPSVFRFGRILRKVVNDG
jgi:hypothetical protein